MSCQVGDEYYLVALYFSEFLHGSFLAFFHSGRLFIGRTASLLRQQPSCARSPEGRRKSQQSWHAPASYPACRQLHRKWPSLTKLR